jgi:hypothetical protein
MSDVIYLSNVRLSFPHLAEPQRQKNEMTGKERISYNCELLMLPDHPGFQQFMKRYGEMALQKWGEHAQPVMQMVQAERKLRCYGRGEEKVNKKTFQPYDGYAGHVYITCGRDTPPQAIQDDGNPVDATNTMAYQAITRRMYGGCRVNVAIKPWLQENQYGRGVRADLVAIQFAGDDKAFGEGAADVSPMFKPVAAAPAAAPAATIPGLPPFLQG